MNKTFTVASCKCMYVMYVFMICVYLCVIFIIIFMINPVARVSVCVCVCQSNAEC